MNQRFYSLDVFRGATVALMILVNNPGSWSHIYAPLDHASWHGCTPTDLVFPFFLFAVGNALQYTKNTHTRFFSICCNIGPWLAHQVSILPLNKWKPV